MSPVKLSRDDSLSFFLNGCQIIERNQVDGGTGGFEVTEGFVDEGVTETDVTVTEESTEDVPF